MYCVKEAFETSTVSSLMAQHFFFLKTARFLVRASLKKYWKFPWWSLNKNIWKLDNFLFEGPFKTGSQRSSVSSSTVPNIYLFLKIREFWTRVPEKYSSRRSLKKYFLKIYIFCLSVCEKYFFKIPQFYFSLRVCLTISLIIFFKNMIFYFLWGSLKKIEN